MLGHPNVYIIAEAGVNHNGSVELAKELIDAAAHAGADAVKFQSFKTENMITRRTPKAAYQKRTTDAMESQFDMIKKLELDEHSHIILHDYCRKKRIQFLSTPHDCKSMEFLLRRLHLPLIKISSGDITNAPLLLRAAQSGKPVILSTGMSTLSEVELALGVLAFGYLNNREKPLPQAFQKAFVSEEGQTILKEKIVLLHCTTEYPTSFDEVHLRAIKTMRSAFNLPVGYSDHTTGIAIATAVVALGASVIEKHFTMNRQLPGPDHRASLEPQELQVMITAIRQVELSLGSTLKIPTYSELKNKNITRKSLVASRIIKKGESFSEQNLAVKRPGTGISPYYYWEWIGKKAKKDYAKDEILKP